MDDIPSTSKASSSSSTQPQEYEQFTLSSIIQGHNDDAKCVVEHPNGELISGGRDGFLKFWENRNGTWENITTAQQKDNLSINSIAFGSLPSTGWEYLIFLGRKNGSIALFSPANPTEPIKVLQGHKSNVCALHFDEETGFMMSGSWDHKAVVWPVEQLLSENGSDVAVGFLDGHNCSVWSVATVPSKPTKFLTASADKTIKLWSHKYDEIGIFLGHSDVVRSLVVLSEIHFLSTSNDASIILWDLSTGVKLRSFLPQHDNFIYTINRLQNDPDGRDLVISAGEGGCIDIWKLKSDATLQHKQSMKMPVNSVWSVCSMKNGDFAAATSSGMVLIFTKDPTRKAADDIQEFFYSSQYEELALKEKETQKAKDSSFDMNLFSTQNEDNGPENGFFKRVVGTEFGNQPYHDPFTGSGRYVPGSVATVAPTNTDKKRPSNHLVPMNDFYKFGLDGLSSKVLTRLRDMNLNQPKNLKMTDEEVASTEEILTQTDEFEINELQIVALEKGIKWPLESIVPTLDIFRIALLHPKFNEIFCSLKPVFGNPPKGRQTIGQLLGFLTNPDSTEPIRILACRALTNSANHEFGRQMLLSEIAAFCHAISKQLCSPKPALQISSASALANFARILLPKTDSKEEMAELGPREDVLQSMIAALRSEQNFSAFSQIAIIRLLQAAIMLMWGQSTLIYAAMEKDFGTILNRIKDAVAEEDVKMLIRDALGMLQAM